MRNYSVIALIKFCYRLTITYLKFYSFQHYRRTAIDPFYIYLIMDSECKKGCLSINCVRENEELRLQVRERDEEIMRLKVRLQNKEKEMRRLRCGILEPLQSFHLFPQLPPEIRCQIWQLMIPPPQIIPIGLPFMPSDCDKKRILYIDRNDGIGKVSSKGLQRLCIYDCFASKKPRRFYRLRLPAIVHTCQESRQLAIGAYNLCFGIRLASSSTIYVRSFLDNKAATSIHTIIPHKLVNRDGIHFRPECDIICLTTESGKSGIWDVLHVARTDELGTENIQQLIIDIKGFEQLIDRWERPNSFFPHLTNLFVTANEADPSGKFLSLREIMIRIMQAIRKYKIETPGALFSSLRITALEWKFVQSLHNSGTWHNPSKRIALHPSYDKLWKFLEKQEREGPN